MVCTIVTTAAFQVQDLKIVRYMELPTLVPQLVAFHQSQASKSVGYLFLFIINATTVNWIISI